MNIACDVIKDLLPLYIDGACSNESKIMVEEHLGHCESCKAELKAMNEVLLINNKEQNLEEASEIKSLSKKWKKGMLILLLKGILFTLLAVTVLAFFLNLFMGIKIE